MNECISLSQMVHWQDPWNCFCQRFDGQDNLIAIYLHRTPISLKAYCLIFIYLFPLVYTPTIIHKMGSDSDAMFLTSFVVLLSEFILISLYNIQDQMEYPFDDDGLDDIQLQKFKSERE